ncbi:MAG: serine acetyltransferase [Lachnospiraceae bacterium]|nr:serine acetyltransferase [Lachnospiraceae bacterium]
MGDRIEKEIHHIVSDILEDYKGGRDIDKVDIFNQPNKNEIIEIIDGLLRILYPGYYRDRVYKIYRVDSEMSVIIEDVMYHLNKQIAVALHFLPEALSEEKIAEESQRISVAFFKKIPEVRERLNTDLQAAFDGDPATRYKEEIILSYPGLFAISVNRLAHELFLLDVPLIPRIMTEHAHNVTGIDIHPGATIGNYFFIDHGTGIVIGETAIIGEHVKIYQGVTIGALSTRGGQRLRNMKRHPTIGDHVTIYAGASILGGETYIGKNSVIGSNAFITTSVPDDTRVSIRNQELAFRQDKKKKVQVEDLGQSEDWYYVI